MRKVLVGGALLVLISGAALLNPTIRDIISHQQVPAKVVASKTQTKVTEPRDPKTHDFSDVDYAQKKLLHHQLGAMIADKGYDSEAIRAQIASQGSRAVIPRKRNSIKGNADLDRGLYRYRHLVENAFARLKQYRALATRFDKLKRNYESVVAMACAFLWLPM